MGKGAGAQEERDKGMGEVFLLFSALSGVWREDGTRLFLEVHRDRTRGKEDNCNREIPVRCKEFFFRKLLLHRTNERYL